MNSYSKYSQIADAHPPLPLEAELALMRTVSSPDSTEAARREAIETLVHHNMRHALRMGLGAAHRVAARGHSAGSMRDECVQVAVRALFEAARRSRDVGRPLFAFASKTIRGDLREQFYKIPVVTISKYGRERARGHHSHRATKTDFSAAVSNAEGAQQVLQSFDSEHENDFQYAVLSAEDDVASEVSDRLDLESALEVLKQADRELVCNIFGIGCDPISAADLARERKVSRQYIHKLLEASLVKMRTFINRRTPVIC